MRQVAERWETRKRGPLETRREYEESMGFGDLGARTGDVITVILFFTSTDKPTRAMTKKTRFNVLGRSDNKN